MNTALHALGILNAIGSAIYLIRKDYSRATFHAVVYFGIGAMINYQ